MANAVDDTNGMIYLLGGIANYGDNSFPRGAVGIADAYAYDAKTNTWSTLPNLPATRGGGAAVVLNNKLHFFNGAVYDGANGGFQEDMKTHWVLDLANKDAGWKTLASNSLGRNHVGGVVWGGKIYAIGGQFHEEEGCSNQKIAEVYNPQTNKWKRIANLPIGTGHISPSTLAHKHGIIVVGGVTDKNSGCKPPGYARNQLLFYDPTTDKWTDIYNKHTGASMVSGIIDGNIYAQHGNSVKRIDLVWNTGANNGKVEWYMWGASHTATKALNIGDAPSATVHNQTSTALVSAVVAGLCTILVVVGAIVVSHRRTATKVPAAAAEAAPRTNVIIL
jgi:N-acetylneuraminic acid mutarotase